MATVDQSGIIGKIRDRPITDELETLLKNAAQAAGIDVVFVTSGGQPGSTGQRTGSTRHDGGRAADLQLIVNGQRLTFTDQSAPQQLTDFITACAARGAIGIGAGVAYMGNKTIHVGYGTSPQDQTRVVWGAGGASANAPAWLRAAASQGWNNPVSTSAPVASASPIAGRFVVIAKGGLRLRGGPGLGFGIITTVPAGTKVTVSAFDGPNREWARVDLEDDGHVDGHLFAAFLAPLNNEGNAHELADEPA